MFGCLAWFCVDATRGVDFGLAMLWFLLFTPCSFVCWYRPLYGAFRYADTWIITSPSAAVGRLSQRNSCLMEDELVTELEKKCSFFLNYFIAPRCSLTTLFSVSTTGVTVHSASLSSSSSISVSLGFTFYKLLASLAGEHGEDFTDSLPTTSARSEVQSHCRCFVFFPSGWIASLTGLNKSIPVGIIMLLIAALFTALSVGSLIMFKKVTQPRHIPTCQRQFLCLIDSI